MLDVMVNGQLVVLDGKTVDGNYPGWAARAPISH